MNLPLVPLTEMGDADTNNELRLRLVFIRLYNKNTVKNLNKLKEWYAEVNVQNSPVGCFLQSIKNDQFTEIKFNITGNSSDINWINSNISLYMT